VSGVAASKERTARHLAAARGRGALAPFIGRLELYCATPACSVREVVVRVKELSGPTPARLTCPACRHPLKLHWVHTREEHADALEQGLPQ
jgi:hypothetical protein